MPVVMQVGNSIPVAEVRASSEVQLIKNLDRFGEHFGAMSRDLATEIQRTPNRPGEYGADRAERFPSAHCI